MPDSFLKDMLFLTRIVFVLSQPARSRYATALRAGIIPIVNHALKRDKFPPFLSGAIKANSKLSGNSNQIPD